MSPPGCVRFTIATILAEPPALAYDRSSKLDPSIQARDRPGGASGSPLASRRLVGGPEKRRAVRSPAAVVSKRRDGIGCRHPGRAPELCAFGSYIFGPAAIIS
jgi:hypothetical protein